MLKVLVPEGVCSRLIAPSGYELRRVSGHEPIPSDEEGAEALVTWGNSSEWLTDAAMRLHRLRWVQSLGSGTEQVLAAGFAPDVVITNGAGLHDAPVAEHALALILAAARRLDLLHDAQRRREWSDRGGRQPGDEASAFSTLRGRRVTIWGFGGIGQTLAAYVSTLGATVTGVARSGGVRAGFEVVAMDGVDRLLPGTDVLVLTAPGGRETRHILDAARMRLLPPHAWIINVGRGSCIDEVALVDALRRGAIAGAALDVTETEPLPHSSPLWDAPNTILTPHAAGGRPLGSEHLIAHNAAALRGEVPWRNRVGR
ncbi:NAD(P)-dependent oxidoreductase [Microbacterium sp. PRC9]|uniref:NAD(P)-dependent oxidoreductase n=1 Tax=Microbacterium sp. PRC9 TaxID=2962591 RepID=UPI002882D2D7|nr:NAD(P)-dependent oxidoreductase [Microbacterium sp. PRC9]MDT0144827.1 NAD(P)-dependent oxidoreductase [Microbacterium sp. PRC9]